MNTKIEPILRTRKGNINREWYVEYYTVQEGKKKRHQIKSHQSLNEKYNTNPSKITSKKTKEKYYNELLKLVTAELRNTQHSSNMKITISQALDLAIEQKKNKIESKTLKSYQYRIQHLKEFLRKRQIQQHSITAISTQMLQQYLNTTDNSKTRVNEIKAIFQALLEKKIISTNPAKDLKTKRTIIQSNQIYTIEQAKEIITQTQAIDKELNLAINLIYYCMMRPVEVTRTTINQINFAQKTITIPDFINKKSKRTRVIPITNSIISAIEAISPTDYILGNKYNELYLSTKFQRLKTKIEIPQHCTLYSFKHTGAVNLYEATKDVVLVMQYCGHQRVETTMNYLRNYGINTLLQQNQVPEINSK